jgi:hypothetical protein
MVTITEFRPPSAFNATPDEARQLITKARNAYASLARWPITPHRDAAELEREYMRQFRASMIALSTMARRPDVDYSRSFDFWMDYAERQNQLIDICVPISGRPFWAAIVASADISFTPFWTDGAERAIGLSVGGDGRRSEVWRKLLAGEIEVPKSVEARPLRQSQRSQVRFFGGHDDEGQIW